MIIEESPSTQQLLGFALARIGGLEIHRAQSGIEALRRLTEQHFDLIITNIDPPLMGGVKLLRGIRKDPNHRNVRVVAVSAMEGDEERERVLSLGADECLAMPLHAQAVIDSVKRLLRLA